MQIRKALTFRASSLGDCLMAKYLLDNIHAQFPEAKLGIVVASRGAMIKDLLQDAPYIEVIEANRRDVRALFKLWRAFKSSDLVVTQYAGKHAGAFGLASKCAARLLAKRHRLVGFIDSSKWNTYLYDQLLRFTPEEAVVEHERAVLRSVGLPVTISYPTMALKTREEVLEKFSLQKKTYILMHFFAGNKGRSITPQKARTLVQKISEAFKCTIVISGAKDDRQIAQTIAEGLKHVHVVAGDASLQEMFQIAEGAKGVVSVDTGIAHISAQLGVPLVVMRTCLGPNWWFPEQYGPHATIKQFSREDLCNPHVKKDYPDCINEIDLDDITKVALELFDR